MIHKKIMLFCAFLLANLAFSAPVNEANRIIDIQQRQLEQERVRQQQEKMQKEFENTKFDSPKPQVDKNIESNISDDYIIGPPYISNGIIGIPELNPSIMDKVRNSPTYKSGNKNDTNPTLIASYAQLKNPCRNGEGIVDSIFSRINASSILGNDRR